MTGSALRDRVASGFVPFVGVYDAFSAAVAGRHADHLFLSGYGFAASQYGLPDVGFVPWTEMVAFAERVRAILPGHGILVDIDDGYGDPEIVAHVIRRMEAAGATGVVLITFTTALADLEPLITELFDAVIAAAEWVPPAPASAGLRAELGAGRRR